MDSDAYRRALIGATVRWQQLDKARKEAREAVFRAAANYMLHDPDVPAADVAALTPFSDALVRAETRRLNVPERRRGPQRKSESKSAVEMPRAVPTRPTTSTATGRGPLFISPGKRRAELLAMAEGLSPARQSEIVQMLEANHPIWFRGKRRPGRSDLDIIALAIDDNLLGPSELR